jgi:hypothetical protein
MLGMILQGVVDIVVGGSLGVCMPGSTRDRISPLWVACGENHERLFGQAADRF